jgi:hypothetical protein
LTANCNDDGDNISNIIYNIVCIYNIKYYYNIEINTNDIDRTYMTNEENQMRIKFSLVNLVGENHLGDIGVDGELIFCSVRLWIKFSWLKTDICDTFFVHGDESSCFIKHCLSQTREYIGFSV